jgi:hypothetical protein
MVAAQVAQGGGGPVADQVPWCSTEMNSWLPYNRRQKCMAGLNLKGHLVRDWATWAATRPATEVVCLFSSSYINKPYKKRH